MSFKGEAKTRSRLALFFNERGLLVTELQVWLRRSKPNTSLFPRGIWESKRVSRATCALSLSLCMGMKVPGRGKVHYAQLSLSVCVTARACGSGLGLVCVWIGFSRALRSQEVAKSVTLPLFVRFMSVWIKRNLVSNQGKCFEKLTEACKVALNNLLLFIFY